MYLGPCTQHRLVVGAELLSSMQHNESEVSDCELIAALEAYRLKKRVIFSPIIIVLLP